MRKLVGIASLFLVLTSSVIASASSAGFAGGSGKGGAGCGGCHSGGAAPTATIDGPTTLAAGASGDYTLTVTTALAKTGADIAGGDGVTFTPSDASLKALSGELVQSAPLATTSGAAVYKFSVTAPAFGTSFTLYASGLAADGTGGVTGDGTIAITQDIAVTGGSAAPPPAATTSTDGTTTTSKKTTKAGDDDDDGTTTPAKDTRDPWQDSACAATPGPSTGGAFAAVFVALGLVALGRRRR